MTQSRRETSVRRQSASGLNSKQNNLVGKLFHIPDGDGDPNIQGKILRRHDAGYYLCQLFSAITGEPTNCVLQHIGQMADWTFYTSAKRWRSTYSKSGR